MRITQELFQHMMVELGQRPSGGEIKVSRVPGGDINQAFRLERNGRCYFAKLNDAKAYPGMFETEAKGLSALGEAAPQPLLVGKLGETAYLLLPWIESATASPDAQGALGRLLAAIHHNTAPQFGLAYDNYIGSLPQSNQQRYAWSDFYVTQRLEPQLKLATDKRLITGSMRQDFERLFRDIQHFDPKEQPSLVHGDLWSGNYLISRDNQPYLIDPAVYYGCREVDIGMSLLFGGFSGHFYDAYNEAFPLNKGWENRVALWQLYPLLVHVNLFGGSYLPQIRERLGKYF